MLKTITLFQNDDPCFVLCPGHVDKKTFNQAFKNEGWDQASYKQDDLRYEYWAQTGKSFKKSLPTKKGSKKFTTAFWD